MPIAASAATVSGRAPNWAKVGWMFSNAFVMGLWGALVRCAPFYAEGRCSSVMHGPHMGAFQGAPRASRADRAISAHVNSPILRGRHGPGHLNVVRNSFTAR